MTATETLAVVGLAPTLGYIPLPDPKSFERDLHLRAALASFKSPTLPSIEGQILPPTAPPSPYQGPLYHGGHARSASVPPTPRRELGKLVPEPFEMPEIHSGPMRRVMNRMLHSIDMDGCEAHGENAFFVCDLAEVWRANERWLRALGGRDGSRQVEAFFAVKCNPDPVILRLLANLGLGFDCASQSEISLVLSLGVDPARIIYANPCKAASFIRHAASAGVDLMTFDNFDELAKIRRHHSKARLVLRLLTDDSGSLCRFGLKFGADLASARPLLMRARELGLNVVGVSFHVGSGCTKPSLYRDAIARSKVVFDLAAELGYRFDLLDVGGGFGGDTFEAMAGVIRDALDEYFPRGQGVRVIAEPGRFYVTEAFELATNIIARRGLPGQEAGDDDIDRPPIAEVAPGAGDDGDAGPVVMYYINEGVYGVFNCTMFDHQIVHPAVLTLDGGLTPVDDATELTTSPCSIWGPTCDSIDCVSAQSQLPTDRLAVGDWLLWRSMGAYTICAASQFNGFRRSEVAYTIDDCGQPKVAAKVRALMDLGDATIDDD